MRRRGERLHWHKSHGYTIVEVLIVLAVSGALAVSVMTTISGQQAKTEFATATRDFENKLIDVLNDVENGFYANTGESCRLDGSGNPVIDAIGTREQGTNDQCVFLGKAVRAQGLTTDAASELFIYTIAGRRTAAAAGTDQLAPTTLSNANPRIFGVGDRYELPLGVELSKIVKYEGGIPTDQRSFAVLGNVAAAGRSAGTTAAGVGKAQLVNVPSTFQTSETDFRSAIATNLPSSTIADGLVFCLRQGQNGRLAAVAIGVSLDQAGTPVQTGQQTSTELFFDDDAGRFGCTAA